MDTITGILVRLGLMSQQAQVQAQPQPQAQVQAQPQPQAQVQAQAQVQVQAQPQVQELCAEESDPKITELSAVIDFFTSIINPAELSSMLSNLLSHFNGVHKETDFAKRLQALGLDKIRHFKPPTKKRKEEALVSRTVAMFRRQQQKSPIQKNQKKRNTPQRARELYERCSLARYIRRTLFDSVEEMCYLLGTDLCFFAAALLATASEKKKIHFVLSRSSNPMQGPDTRLTSCKMQAKMGREIIEATRDISDDSPNVVHVMAWNSMNSCSTKRTCNMFANFLDYASKNPETIADITVMVGRLTKTTRDLKPDGCVGKVRHLIKIWVPVEMRNQYFPYCVPDTELPDGTFVYSLHDNDVYKQFYEIVREFEASGPEPAVVACSSALQMMCLNA